MHSILIALALLVTQLPGANPETPASLAGVVTRVGTGRPVTRAEVQLLGESGETLGTTMTDPAGRFAFDPIDPGTYRLVAARNGYVTAEFGQRRIGRPGQSLSVRAGERRTDLSIGMTATGVISGQVRDIYGEPVVNANVEALRFSYDNGRRILGPIQRATTNDLGEYRLFWMQPGEYVVRVGASPAANVIFTTTGGETATFVYRMAATQITAGAGVPPPPPPPPPPDQFIRVAPQEPSVPIYYPGTTDPSQALTIDLAAGTEFPGVNVVLTDEAVVRVSGRVIDPVTGTSPAGTSVTLTSRASVLVDGTGQRRAPVRDDGTFEIDGVLPGSYDLTARVGGAVRNVRITAGPGGERTQILETTNDEPLYAQLPVDIRAGTMSVENLVLELAPSFDLTGRITPPVGESVDLASLSVVLKPDRSVFGAPIQPVPVEDDGTFRIEGLPPTDYRGLDITGLSAGMYLEEARMGAFDILNSPVRVDGNLRAQLDVQLGSNVGSVDVGTFGADGERALDMTVVLAPGAPRRGRADLYRVGSSDANGLIRFEDVPPGDYKVFAWEEVPDGAWENTDFMRAYESAGVAVFVAPGSREQASVTVRP